MSASPLLTSSMQRRFAAGLIDILVFAFILVCFALVLVFPFLVMGFLSLTSATFAGFISQFLWLAALTALLSLYWVYFAGLEASFLKGTVGKILLGIEVTDHQGQALTLKRSSLRTSGKLLSLLSCGLGFFLAIFHSRKKSLHDFCGQSLVVTRRS